jgi:UDP-N-acetylmuramate--alanine ligase
MSAIALVLAGMGHQVSGSDVHESPVLDRLRAAGVKVHVGHDPALGRAVDAVTASTAIPRDNVELVAAARAGVAVLTRAGMLASICACAQSLGIAGTHGKTTTTSMLTVILDEAGLDPSFVVGGDVLELGTGARWTGGEWMVVEADESDRTHLELPLAGTVLTNVETDHLDHYGTFDEIVAGFDRYLAGVDGPKVVCVDDPVAAELADRHGAITYGIDGRARYRAVDAVSEQGSLRFSVRRDGEPLGDLTVPLRGLHNVRNATAAVALADVMGVPFEASARALGRFGGVRRRFDVRSRRHGITLVDDYAHLPTEIAAVLEAAATSGDQWQRIVSVFQPNRFNRMAILSPEYRDAFVHADVAVITDIYASGTTPIEGVTGKLVVDAVCDAHPEQRVVWLRERSDLVSFLARELRAGDVCISMGCGDVESLPDEVVARWTAGERTR